MLIYPKLCRPRLKQRHESHQSYTLLCVEVQNITDEHMFKSFKKTQPNCVHVSEQVFREEFSGSLTLAPTYYYRKSCPVSSTDIPNFTSEVIILLALSLVRCPLQTLVSLIVRNLDLLTTRLFSGNFALQLDNFFHVTLTRHSEAVSHYLFPTTQLF